MEYSIQTFEPLKNLMEEIGKEKLDMWIDLDRLFIQGAESELMLRLKHYSNSLVIARIQVSETGRGHGKKILDWITDYANSNEYKSIMIESAMTEAAIKFAKKNGFAKIQSPIFKSEGDLFCNWGKAL